MKRTLLILRTMKRTGTHLHQCFADAAVRLRRLYWTISKTERQVARVTELESVLKSRNEEI